MGECRKGANVGSGDMSDVDLAARVARLTAGQRECLDLVDDHATSKEIARQLGISRHTVDARLRGAIQTLGVSSRREAAIIYRAAAQAQAQTQPQTYHPFAYQSPQIVNDRDMGPQQAHENDAAHFGQLQAGHQPEPAIHAPAPEPVALAASAAPQWQPVGAHVAPLADHVSDSAAWAIGPAGELPQAKSSLRLWGGANDLTSSQRMVGILVVMILAMLAFGMFLSGIQALVLIRS